MNKYLPRKSELEPITDNWNMFAKCGFNKPFEELDFQTKLQVAVDLVRQSILPNSYPDPNTEKETLIGDCHTAALALIDYLKYLDVGKNYKYIMCKQTPYQPEDLSSRHAAVLVEDDNGEMYFVDATPFVGYMFGGVVKCTNGEVPYKQYEELTGEKLALLTQMREFLHKCANNEISTYGQAKPYLNGIIESKKFSILNSYASKCYYKLSTITDDLEQKNRFENIAKLLEPYKFGNNKEKSQQKDVLTRAQILKWKEDLKHLRLANPRDLKEELKYSRWIYQESKLMDDSLEMFVNIGGESKRITDLTPRLFLEEGISVIMVKPSAYFLGVQDIIKERMIGNSEVLFSYECNLGKINELTGLRPMQYAHPYGEQFERFFTGKSEVIALRRGAPELKRIKKELRSEFGSEYNHQKFMWYDGKEIEWNSNELNLIHSTDDPVEACLHVLIAKPEQQHITLFSYPNPVIQYADRELCKREPNIPYGEERLEAIDRILTEKRTTMTRPEPTTQK